MRRLAILAALVTGLGISAANADAITEFFDSEIEIFSNRNGDGTPQRIAQKDLDVKKAAIRSKETGDGFIRVRFVYKDNPDRVVTGWVDTSALSIDRSQPTIEVPGCPPIPEGQVATRGGRMLGGDC